ncbi:MAG TPA: NADH-quinone oxidoreductase subunit J [Gemmatimonadales bacterium]|jgi:NADH-quinone oxidoreductase subunit J|nr:NADH-quinone oxidoreductase subunit J [Gemmatimonadales bacterium]
MTEVIFYIFAAFAVLSAALCILQKNPVSAALWLVSTMFSLAAIYVLLNAQFIAAIQVLVYAGAVMVLFLFVIMLLNLGQTQSDIRGPSSIAATLVIVGLLAIELVALLRYTPRRLASELSQWPTFTDPATVFVAGQITQQETASKGVVGAVAAPLFQTYLIPFEITSILLLAAIIGAVVLAKRNV